MASEPVPLTPAGLARLTAELEYLRTVKRHEIAERIHEAWENDAARDNVPSYDYAKNDQAMVEGRILELEYMISNESPVGRALIGKQVGDNVEVMVPAGVQRFKITSIA